MNTREKLGEVMMHLVDHGKIELGTPESAMLTEIVVEFDAVAEKLERLEKENSDYSWSEASRNGWLMDGR